MQHVGEGVDGKPTTELLAMAEPQPKVLKRESVMKPLSSTCACMMCCVCVCLYVCVCIYVCVCARV